MRFLVCSLALSVSAFLEPATAKTVLTPGPKPTAIEPGREPFAFQEKPTIRPVVGHEEPFLEGDITYGYGGRLVTPVQRGSDIIAPANSVAYGVPMRVRDRDNLAQVAEHPQLGGKNWATEAGPPELAWCIVTRPNGASKVRTVCLFNEGLAFGGYDSLLNTANYLIDRDKYGGGEIRSARVDFGAPVHVRYFVQNLGKIARIRGQVWLGDQMVNQWGYVFGDIGRGSQPDERLFSIAGGVIGIAPDLSSKGHYKVRIVSPVLAGGSAQLVEKRNDSGAPETLRFHVGSGPRADPSRVTASDPLQTFLRG